MAIVDIIVKPFEAPASGKTVQYPSNQIETDVSTEKVNDVLRTFANADKESVTLNDRSHVDNFVVNCDAEKYGLANVVEYIMTSIEQARKTETPHDKQAHWDALADI